MRNKSSGGNDVPGHNNLGGKNKGVLQNPLGKYANDVPGPQ